MREGSFQKVVGINFPPHSIPIINKDGSNCRRTEVLETSPGVPSLNKDMGWGELYGE